MKAAKDREKQLHDPTIRKTFKEDLEPDWACGKNTKQVQWQLWRSRPWLLKFGSQFALWRRMSSMRAQRVCRECVGGLAGKGCGLFWIPGMLRDCARLPAVSLLLWALRPSRDDQSLCHVWFAHEARRECLRRTVPSLMIWETCGSMAVQEVQIGAATTVTRQDASVHLLFKCTNTTSKISILKSVGRIAGEIIALFLEDWQLARVVLSCRLDLVCQECARSVAGEPVAVYGSLSHLGRAVTVWRGVWRENLERRVAERRSGGRR